MNFKELYEKVGDDEYLQFERVAPKLSSRPDIHAFILLNRLVPGKRDILSGAEHDEVYLDVTLEELDASGATLGECLDLIRAGVRYDSQTESLAMFV